MVKYSLQRSSSATTVGSGRSGGGGGGSRSPRGSGGGLKQRLVPLATGERKRERVGFQNSLCYGNGRYFTKNSIQTCYFWLRGKQVNLYK